MNINQELYSITEQMILCKYYEDRYNSLSKFNKLKGKLNDRYLRDCISLCESKSFGNMDDFKFIVGNGYTIAKLLSNLENSFFGRSIKIKFHKMVECGPEFMEWKILYSDAVEKGKVFFVWDQKRMLVDDGGYIVMEVLK